jgi:hypothetical protein
VEVDLRHAEATIKYHDWLSIFIILACISWPLALSGVALWLLWSSAGWRGKRITLKRGVARSKSLLHSLGQTILESF